MPLINVREGNLKESYIHRRHQGPYPMPDIVGMKLSVLRDQTLQALGDFEDIETGKTGGIMYPGTILEERVMTIENFRPLQKVSKIPAVIVCFRLTFKSVQVRGRF